MITFLFGFGSVWMGTYWGFGPLQAAIQQHKITLPTVKYKLMVNKVWIY